MLALTKDLREAERLPGHGLPGELLEQSRVKDASDLNKERKLRFRRNPGGWERRDENRNHNAASLRCV